MTDLRSVCVYCGSAVGNHPAYAEAADAFGAALAREDLTLVYGGGSIGLMGRTAKSCLEAGGTVVGVIPQFLVDREVMLRGVTELVVTDDMHTRKKTMYDLSDAFVALPGGIGTLEEMVEMMTWAKLGHHRKPMVLVDLLGFWRPLVRLLEHMHETGFLDLERDFTYLVAETVDEVIPKIRDAVEEERTISARDKATLARM